MKFGECFNTKATLRTVIFNARANCPSFRFVKTSTWGQKQKAAQMFKLDQV